ncbi:YwaF family protein [Alteribacter natronophilus]|uniref:YwaF family protein n=1 Tax=Alteribacter natronophilus TaxID=2583810 RepID=UPI00110E7D89|nr:TIGR02206 family membrane protein [Alteribacter natronophilus]TMW73454.1 TIGR02206 family membrane protein [Alteribacter natronophilus]
MNFFQGTSGETPFVMFSAEHLLMIAVLFAGIAAIVLFRHRLRKKPLRKWEIGTAVTLVLLETGYHVWLLFTGNWGTHHALPLELCNISLIMIIVVLLTRHRATQNIVLFIGIAGALQAIMTPVLSYGLPHFRFVHFFYTHILIIWTAVYFAAVRGYRPDFSSVWKALLFLNLLLPFILFVNSRVEGNYWFLTGKPEEGSLLDFLGPHPWYIVSLELVAFVTFVLIWLLFRERKKNEAGG